MDKPINLASLPREQMLLAARFAARSVFADEEVISAVAPDLREAWFAKHMPRACGQTDEEFGKLVELVCDEFDVGINDAIAMAKTSATTQPATRAVETEGVLPQVHELTATIWGVAGVCQEEAGSRYVDAYVARMSNLAYEIEQAIINSCPQETQIG